MPRTFLSVLIAGLFSCCAWGQVSLVRVTGCGPQIFPASSCTIPSTGSGNLLVVAWMSGGATGGESTTIAGVTDNAGNIYSEAGNSRSTETVSHLMADLWYAKNSRSGATVLTITPNPAGISGEAVIWEFSGVDTTAPLDQSAVLNSMAATTTPSGAPVTTTSPAAVVISVIQVQDKV